MPPVRSQKGKSLWAFPDDYTVVDIETNGLFSGICEIIEISAIKYRNNKKTDVFSVLIKPSQKIDGFITRLTGITDDMVKDGADIREALIGFRNFVGSDILLGYNVNFDIDFLYDNMLHYLDEPLTNDFVDVLRFSRRALKNIENHKQTTVAAYYGISTDGAHRAETDCLICNAVYTKLKQCLTDSPPLFNNGR